MATDLRGALKWLLPLLGGPARLADLDPTLAAIDDPGETP
jgi:hypothetical protein